MDIRGFFMKIIDNDLTIQEVCGRIGDIIGVHWRMDIPFYM